MLVITLKNVEENFYFIPYIGLMSKTYLFESWYRKFRINYNRIRIHNVTELGSHPESHPLDPEFGFPICPRSH
jgi:hypothetical protein